MKKCPMCAEEVQDDAKVCRFCKHAFDPALSRGAALASKGKPARKGVGCGTALAIGAVVLVLAAVLAPKGASGPSETPAGTGPAIDVTPEQLRAAYDANEAAAQQTYGGQTLRVTGTIAKIDLDLTDDPVLQLETAKRYDEVHANLAESAKGQATSMSKGQKVVLTCAGVSEVIGTPILKDCVPG